VDDEYNRLSDSGIDDEEKDRYPSFNEETDMCNPQLAVGLKFKDIKGSRLRLMNEM